MVSITGGGGLKAALERIAANASKVSHVEVGFPEGAEEDDGTSIPMIAAIQEYGAPKAGIPPRPFFRNMIKEKSGEWPEIIAALLKATDYDASRTLEGIGDIIRADLQQSISDMAEPELSAVTVMLRGMKSEEKYKGLPFGKLIAAAVERVKAGKSNYGASTKPLIDSGDMRASVTAIVKD